MSGRVNRTPEAGRKWTPWVRPEAVSAAKAKHPHDHFEDDVLLEPEFPSARRQRARMFERQVRFSDKLEASK